MGASADRSRAVAHRLNEHTAPVYRDCVQRLYAGTVYSACIPKKPMSEPGGGLIMESNALETAPTSKTRAREIGGGGYRADGGSREPIPEFDDSELLDFDTDQLTDVTRKFLSANRRLEVLL